MPDDIRRPPQTPPPLRPVTLEDKYTATEGTVFLSGTQALVRLPLTQVRRDRAAGLNTAAFISGYRGSPLGGLDQQLWRAAEHLAAHDVVFQPGVNEDLAATAVWGSQQLHLSPGARRQGVVGLWYGKGPGVDRSGDVFKHGNAAGSAPHGGVLCLAGDDHGAKSSTLPHQSDHEFMAALMPMLYPSSVQEFLEMGLLGIAMSRYSGCWVGMKVIADTVETTSVVDLAQEARDFVLPGDFEMPPGGLNLRWPDDRWTQDHRLQNHKGFAAIAFARANRVDRIIFDSPGARLGIVATGKAYEDVRQALRELDIDASLAADLGLKLYKVGMPWPLEPEGIRHFAEGLEELLIIEERREIIENQVKQQLYNWRADVRPRVVGKMDQHDRPVLSLSEELTTGAVVRVLVSRLLQFEVPDGLRERLERRLAWFQDRLGLRQSHQPPIDRKPWYCAGCPHNISTKVPEGSRALAGIGCHFMVLWMDRNTETFSHMGGEGAAWAGIAPFTDEGHVFVNMGDGTYYHSGLLAIRQAVAAKVSLTYKILYNDAVAMTGGQAVDGPLSPEQISHQLHQEGVGTILVISDTPEAVRRGALAPGVEVHHRDATEPLMQRLRETPGVSAMIYVQTCATEKRRRRKRGLMPDPDLRVAINPAVCEGCGDCSVQSNCIAIEPLETDHGRKRTINQSACNKDLSCIKGFCPSFVTLEGAKPRRKAALPPPDDRDIPWPQQVPALDRPYNVAVTGVGGTGVLTIGAILGMAAHLEGQACMILDMAGLAQKGGAVLSHVRLSPTVADITSPRIVTGGADVLLAADDVVAASKDGVALCDPSRTRAVVNTHLTPVARFITHRDVDFRRHAVAQAIAKGVQGQEDFQDFTALAVALTGDAIATNILMVGYAWQRGQIPLSLQSIERAIDLNGVAVRANLEALRWGRLAAADPDRVRALIQAPASDASTAAAAPEHTLSLAALIAHREAHLTAYQNAALAKRYRGLVDRVADAAQAHGLGEDLPRAVARNYAKVLAIKDEYEVARLFTDGRFQVQLAQDFQGVRRVQFHLAPPILGGTAPDGRPRKRRFGPWVMPLFRILARLKGVRGTALDLFARTQERRRERALIGTYEAMVETVLAGLTPARAAAAQDILDWPDQIRGFGPVKEAAMDRAEAQRAALLEAFVAPEGRREPAETPQEAA